MGGLTVIDLVSTLEPIEFLVPELLPMGYISFVTAREGIGKTTLLTGLLWQMSRPHGGEWAGFRVPHGSSLYVNSDAPDGRSRPVRYWLERHKTAAPDGDLSRITVLEAAEGLGPEELKQLAQVAKEQGVTCIVIDSYMGAFPGLDPRALEKQMGPLKALVQLAAGTGAALLVTDHHSKGAAVNGEFTAMGSVSKSAQSRAGLSLTRVPPAECEGQNVIRVEVVKQSFARRLEPFGLQIKVESVEWGEGEAVYLETYALPDEKVNTGRYRAKLALLAYLKAHLGVWHMRDNLIKEACKGGNVKDRTAIDALKDVLEELGDRLEQRQEKKKAAPKEYRLLAEGQPSSDPEPQPEPVQAETPTHPTQVHSCTPSLEPVSDEAQPVQRPFAQVNGVARVAQPSLEAPEDDAGYL